MSSGKLIVVSARLPVSVRQHGDAWEVNPSPGGLATALRAVAERRPFTWIGWPGTYVPKVARQAVTERLDEVGGAKPVFISKAEHHGFYEEFSNSLLWPLFHSLADRVSYDRTAWTHYQAVNQRFADVIARVVEPGDTVWIHDYQLCLVPQLVRDIGVECAIGFFMHIPFPSSELYRTLPVRDEILRGMLGADLVGFHTYEYVSNFRSSALRVLGLESEPETVYLPSHAARLGVLPIGIEPSEIEEFVDRDETRRELASLRKQYEGRKVVIGVDRLDYTKGIPEKLLAFEELLRTHPRWRDKAVLIQIASPSRTGVEEYQALKREVDELVGRINGRFGSTRSTPVVYINRHVNRERLAALFMLAEVALITPVRDGMNLVALEYVAARGDDPGTLVLSEFAGAAACLSGARLVNPHNTTGMAETLHDALTQEPSREAHEHMLDFVYTNTSSSWAERFLARLEDTYEELRSGVLRLDVSELSADAVRCRGERPLLLIDYDGTLQSHTTVPRDAVPSRRVIRVLRELAQHAVVYALSGRTADVLDHWLGQLPIGLACEHGLAIKHPGERHWPDRRPIDRTVLETAVRPVLRDFVDRTPGSKIEEKEASMAWHYRAADPKFGAWRAKELYAVLEERLRGHEFSVLAGSRVIEVRHRLASKAHVATELLGRYPDAGLVLACGDDRTDEEMFETLMRSGHDRLLVCHVGSRNTIATYYVETPDELVEQLEQIAALWRAEADEGASGSTNGRSAAASQTTH